MDKQDSTVFKISSLAGQLTIDKFTEVKVMAETSCDTRMSVPLPTMATCEGELVLLDGKLNCLIVTPSLNTLLNLHYFDHRLY